MLWKNESSWGASSPFNCGAMCRRRVGRDVEAGAGTSRSAVISCAEEYRGYVTFPFLISRIRFCQRDTTEEPLAVRRM